VLVTIIREGSFGRSEKMALELASSRKEDKEMRLTWRDGVTTVLAAAVVGIFAANTANWSVPFVENARWASLLIGLVGLSMCIVGGSATVIAVKSPFVVAAGVLGSAAMLLVVIGVATGWSLAVTLLAADTLVLWIVSTIRHAAVSRPAEIDMRVRGGA
jgi:hypothetical protein